MMMYTVFSSSYVPVSEFLCVVHTEYENEFSVPYYGELVNQ